MLMFRVNEWWVKDARANYKSKHGEDKTEIFEGQIRSLFISKIGKFAETEEEVQKLFMDDEEEAKSEEPEKSGEEVEKKSDSEEKEPEKKEGEDDDEDKKSE